MLAPHVTSYRYWLRRAGIISWKGNLRRPISHLPQARSLALLREATLALKDGLGDRVSRSRAEEEARTMVEEASSTEELWSWVEQRTRTNQPMAYVIGKAWFWTLCLHVTPEVLIPRPCSEVLVEQAVRIGKQNLTEGPQRGKVPNKGNFLPSIHASDAHDGHCNVRADLRNNATNQRNLAEDHPEYTVMDIGTGPGTLLLSCLSELPHARGLGVDVSKSALKVASENALRNNLSSRVDFIQADMRNDLNAKLDVLGIQYVDIVLSNPPYIDETDMAELDDAVRDHEPHLALFGGPDGLEFYQALVERAEELTQSGRVRKDGAMILEVGHRQAQDVVTLFQNAGYSQCQVHRDLSGIDRCIVVQLHKKCSH